MKNIICVCQMRNCVIHSNEDRLYAYVQYQLDEKEGPTTLTAIANTNESSTCVQAKLKRDITK
jgi:hypothetical protein